VTKTVILQAMYAARLLAQSSTDYNSAAVPQAVTHKHGYEQSVVLQAMLQQGCTC
jgi:hypothetical protein